MSSQSIKRFLRKIDNELKSKKAGDRVRKRMNAGVIHSFTMSVEDNIAQIMDVLQKRGYPINDDVIAIVERESQELYDQTYRALTVGFDAIGEENVTINADGSFTAVIKDYGKTFKQKSGVRNEVPLDYFDRIKEKYRGKVNTIANRLNAYYESVEPGAFEPIKQKSREGFLDLGHREGSEVAREQTRDARARIYKQFTSKRTKAGQLPPEVFKTLGFDLEVLKKDLEELSKIEVSVESAATNRNTAEEKRFKKELRTQIQSALKKLNKNPAEFKGSDSRLDIDKKRIIKSFQDSVAGNKKVKKKKTANTKINKSKGSQKKSYGKTHKKGQQIVAGVGLKMQGYKAKESEPRQETQLRLQALLNAKLPAEVRKNMGAPRLENRSGRFASSVEVTEISKTKQGFPSIGYTYRKNPYQIFEQGAGRPPWSSKDRDPRTLIDKSIRELAAEIIVGRFYTRRV